MIFHLKVLFFEVDDKASIRDIINILQTQNITSVPVYSTEEKKYLGFIEIKDIVEQLSLASEPNMTRNSVDAINKAMTNFMLTMCAHDPAEREIVRKIALARPFKSLDLGCSIIDVILLMKQGASRVPVINPSTQKIVKIISQSDIIHYLALHSKSLDTKVTTSPISDLKLGFKDVICVRTTDYMYVALHLMARHRMAAIPIIEEDSSTAFSRHETPNHKIYSIVDTINERDILQAASCFLRDDFNLISSDGIFSFFNMKCQDFIHSIRLTAKTRRVSHFFASTVALAPRERIAYVIKKLAATRQHRLYIMDVDSVFEAPSRVYGVVSLIDLIRVLF